MSVLGGITCPPRRDHWPTATDNKSLGLDLLPQASSKITYLNEVGITFLLSISGGITCPTR